MKYEFILKVKTHSTQPFEIRYRCVVPERDYERVKLKYESFVKNSLQVLLINKLDDNGEFIGVIQ